MCGWPPAALTWPRALGAQEDAQAVLALAQARARAVAEPVELSETLVKQLAFTAAGDLPAMCSVLGGIVAQEVLKVRRPIQPHTERERERETDRH
jgi:hypothetical protein